MPAVFAEIDGQVSASMAVGIGGYREERELAATFDHLLSAPVCDRRSAAPGVDAQNVVAHPYTSAAALNYVQQLFPFYLYLIFYFKLHSSISFIILNYTLPTSI